jgi:hypothetical protein
MDNSLKIQQKILEARIKDYDGRIKNLLYVKKGWESDLAAISKKIASNNNPKT